MSASNRPTPKLHSRPRAKSRAQAMVEFGLALPILLLVMYGLIETGRLLFMYASVVSAARQAVRYGSVSGENGAGTPHFNDCAGIRNAAKRMGFLQPIQDADILISYDNGPGAVTPWSQATCPIANAGHPVNGDRISVQVSTDYTPIVPLVRFDPFTISSAGSRTLLMGVSVAVDVPGVVLTPGGTGAMALSKNSSPSSFTAVGQTINYTYTVTNLGATNLTGISMSDDKVSAQGNSVNCSSAVDPLPGGASTSCTASYVTTSGDVAAGALTNNATVTAASPTGPLVAYTSLTINFIPEPALTLAKEGAPPTIIEPGALITYTFTLTNTGNVPLSSPYGINDALIDDDWSCPSGSLAVGASVSCTGTYALKNADINSQSVNNSATATALYNGYTVTSNVATASVPVPPLLLEFLYPPTTTSVPGLGYTISYQYRLSNRESRARSNIVITDITGSFTCTSSLDGYSSVTCPSTPRTYTGYGQSAVDAGQVVNQATAVAQGNVRSNQAAAITTIPQTIQLILDKTASPLTATSLGTVVTYTYKLKNTGNVTLSPPFTVTDNKLTVSCANLSAPLAPNGGEAFCTPVNHTVTQPNIDAGSIINTATASGKLNTQTVTSAADSVTVITYAGARLGLTKSANPNYFSTVNQNINYTFTLRNTGGVILNAPYAVTDPLIPSVNCSGASPTIPVGGSTTCTGTYTVTLANITHESGTIINQATATANGGALSSSQATLTIDKFTCNNSRIKHAEPTPISSGSSVPWVIINTSGLPLSIAAITVSWSGSPPLLTQLELNTTPIWNAPSSASGGFVVPGAPWALPEGDTPMQLTFKNSVGNPMTATGVRVVLTISGPSCNVIVDSNVVYPS